MVIHSSDRRDSIYVHRKEGNGFINYELSASFSGEIVTNEDVVFANADDFLHALLSFESTRTGTAFLDGTEDCHIAIQPDGGAGDGWLSFQVARTLSTFSPKTGSARRSGQIVLAGGFSVAGEWVGQMVRDFGQLFERRA